MKKISSVFIAVSLFLIIAMALASCGEHEHSYSKIQTNPTCTESGYTTYICIQCEDSYIDDFVDALGHNYVDTICSLCYAYEFEADENPLGLELTLSEDGAYYILSGIGSCMESNITIPPVYRSLPVCAIANGAFSGCSGITSVVIPENVTYIGSNAFKDCKNLIEVIILGEDTEIAEDAFVGCENLEENPGSSTHSHSYNEYVTEPTCTEQGYTTYSCECGDSYVDDIKNALGHNYVDGSCSVCGAVEPETFEDERGLRFTLSDDRTYYIFSGVDSKYDKEYIDIPDEFRNLPVKEIGYNALRSGTNFVSVTIPASVTSIGSSAFYNCYALKSVSFGDNSQLQTIGDRAFYNCSALTSIKIPASVTSIGSWAFYNCSVLTSVSLGDNSQLQTIGDWAFENCDALTSVNFGDNSQLQTIGDYAFYSCNKLVEVINKSSLNITKGSYDYGYVAYYALEVHSGESKIVNKDDYLFYTYEGVNYLLGYVGSDTELILPEDYNGENYKIYEYAFSSRNDISSVEIPASVTSIGSDAFYGYHKLVEVINKSSLNITKGSSDYGYVAYYALEVHSVESKIVNKDDYLFYTYEGVNYLIDYVGNDTELILPENYNGENYEIYEYAFYERDDITSVEIPASVTSIGSYAFEYCSALTSIEIPASVTSIGYGAFGGCSALVSVSFGDNSQLQTIGNCAFYDCYSLTSIEIPASVTSIPAYAFLDCDALASIEIPESVTSIGSYAFSSCDALTSIEIPASVTSIGSSAFSGCSILTFNEYDNAYYLGNEENPYYALIKAKDTSINSCTINENTKFIVGGSAFSGCSALTSIEIPASVTSIGSHAFNCCFALTSIEIPASVTSIGSDAFFHCSALTSIEIPASVTGIGEDAFYGCSVLKDVYIYDIASWCNISFGDSSSNPLYYADNLYLKRELVTDVVIPDGVTSIGNYAFANYDALVSIEIPASVTSIDSGAFMECYKLVEVINKSSLNITKGSSVAYYALEVHSGESKIVNKDDYLFYTYEGGNYLIDYVGSDTELILPEDYNGENYEINKYAFYERDDIISVEIPASVTSIGYAAFEYCNALKDVYISDIASWCNISFGNNTSNPLCYADNLYLNGELVTDVVIPDGVTSIGNYAFENYDALVSIEIPASVTSIGSDAFFYCSALTSVSFGDNSQLQSIGSSAFSICSALTSIKIPASVTRIGSYAFYGCHKLVEVYNLSSLAITKGSEYNGYVGYYAFDIYTSLEEESKLWETDDGFIFYEDGETCYLIGYVGSETELVLPESCNGKKYEIYQYAFENQ